jgi:hypothetical protein
MMFGVVIAAVVVVVMFLVAISRIWLRRRRQRAEALQKTEPVVYIAGISFDEDVDDSASSCGP